MAKAALVTGAAKRLGRTIALTLAEAGYDIALHYHQAQHEAMETASAIEALGRNCLPLCADLRRTEDVTALYTHAVQAFPTLDVLVNNASLFENDTLATLTPERFHAHQQANLLAPLLLTQAFAAQSPPTEPRLIINLLDTDVVHRNRAEENVFFSYHLAKAGLDQATHLLARTLAPHVRVNAIAPGPTLPAPTQSAAHFAAQQQNCPLGYGASLEEIAASVRYLLTCPSVTGMVLTVDGGRHLGQAVPSFK
jgi:NAD(P)-dependent dehydrogenase (short-subunit alcohol dehydrogenase family)